MTIVCVQCDIREAAPGKPVCTICGEHNKHRASGPCNCPSECFEGEERMIRHIFQTMIPSFDQAAIERIAQNYKVTVDAMARTAAERSRCTSPQEERQIVRLYLERQGLSRERVDRAVNTIDSIKMMQGFS